MKRITLTLNEGLKNEANNYVQLRKECKKFLELNNRNFDKFTVVSHDSFIGYITEKILKKFLKNYYSDVLKEVRSWEDGFDIARIREIIKVNSSKKEDVDYIKEYFYDKYDLELISGTNRLLIDVKTAFTQKNPQPSWNFLYPVVQAHKEGKDFMVLTYYVTKTANIEDLKEIVLVGYISEDDIKNCNIIKQGEQTRYGTLSQIDNYVTELSVHYKDVNEMINLLK